MAKRASKATIAERMEFVKANHNNMTNLEMANHLNTSYEVIRSIKARLGMQRRPIRRFTMKEKKEIFSLIGRWYYKEIAQKYNCSIQALYRIGREMRDAEKMAKP